MKFEWYIGNPDERWFFGMLKTPYPRRRPRKFTIQIRPRTLAGLERSPIQIRPGTPAGCRENPQSKSASVD